MGPERRSRWNHRRLALAALVFLGVALAAAYSLVDVASETIRYRYPIIGASFYEYYGATNQWPKSTRDLATTSLPARLSFWEHDGALVWNDDLGPNPGANADRVLLFLDSGLLAAFGWTWVCWGDLRVEYVPMHRVQAGLLKKASEDLG